MMNVTGRLYRLGITMQNYCFFLDYHAFFNADINEYDCNKFANN